MWVQIRAFMTMQDFMIFAGTSTQENNQSTGLGQKGCCIRSQQSSKVLCLLCLCSMRSHRRSSQVTKWQASKTLCTANCRLLHTQLGIHEPWLQGRNYGQVLQVHHQEWPHALGRLWVPH